MTVITRFAPSPTGLLHIGGVRTALFSWLYARRMGGKFILRIEDTDLERSTPEAVQVILEGMKWLGLDHDLGPYYQTQRFDRYKEVIARDARRPARPITATAARKTSTRCAPTSRRARKSRATTAAAAMARDRAPASGRQPVVRFKNPEEGATVVEDVVHGAVTFQNKELDDLIIARSDGTPTYNFCVVVDDADMGVTHVIRGDDHLNNTPRQMNMLLALGKHAAGVRARADDPGAGRRQALQAPRRRQRARVPGAGLSTRGAAELPGAPRLVAWRPGILHASREMIAAFDVRDINKSASALNPEKMLWLNQQHLVRADPKDIVPHLQWQLARLGIESNDQALLEGIIVAQRERAKTLKEMAENSRFFFGDEVTLDPKAAEKHLTADARALLGELRARLEKLAEWKAPAIHGVLEALAKEKSLGLGKIAQPLRVAVTGGTVSPPIDATLELLGRERDAGASRPRAVVAELSAS